MILLKSAASDVHLQTALQEDTVADGEDDRVRFHPGPVQLEVSLQVGRHSHADPHLVRSPLDIAVGCQAKPDPGAAFRLAVRQPA